MLTGFVFKASAVGVGAGHAQGIAVPKQIVNACHEGVLSTTLLSGYLQE